MDANEALGLLKLGLDEAYRAIPFDPERTATADGFGDEARPTNGQNADAGHMTLALFCYRNASLPGGYEIGNLALAQYAAEINLTEAPDEALTDLLANLMHYCHREGISFSEALVSAVTHFHAESGGVAI